MRKQFSVALFTAAVGFAATAESRQDILSRMDQAAAAFQSMTADVVHTSHTAVLNENDTDYGRVVLKKIAPGEVQGLMEYTKPDHKFFLFEKRKLQIYTPSDNTVQVYDLGKHGEQLDQFLALGFGTSSKELTASFQVNPGATANEVDLIPTTADGRKLLTRIELWIGPDNYPLKEKLDEPSGDYVLVTYNNVKINPPLGADALQLKLAPGAKYEYPQK